MSELGRVALWRKREHIQFGYVHIKQFDNGNEGVVFRPCFTRNGARYRVSTRMIENNMGIDWENNDVFAVRHLNNDDFKAYVAKWRGNYYKVTHVLPDDSKIVTYDLVTLKKSDKYSGKGGN